MDEHEEGEDFDSAACRPELTGTGGMIKTEKSPIIRSDTVRWSRPAGRMAPRAVPTRTQHTATRAITAMNHLNEPGFHASRPQQPLGGSSEKRPLQKTNSKGH
ncbi:hypothetical protein MTP99_017547 [Tenebrio molitor]|jgi:hypothetical protein|nr:hypothetical protein MTP99_017547 [Tenebrio molitor]